LAVKYFDRLGNASFACDAFDESDLEEVVEKIELVENEGFECHCVVESLELALVLFGALELAERHPYHLVYFDGDGHEKSPHGGFRVPPGRRSLKLLFN